MPANGTTSVEQVIGRKLGVSVDGQSDERLLATDLHVQLEDAEALFAILAERFGLRGEIELERYFDGFQVQIIIPEFSPILMTLYPRLREQWRSAPPRPDFSVSHLLASVRAGTWTEPPPLKATEPLEWVGKRTLTPIFKAFRFLAYAFSYLIAGVVVFFAAQFLTAGFSDALRGYWAGAVFNAVGVIFWGFILICMLENTQRRVRARFGLSWDWRRGSLREPRPKPVGQPN